MNIVYRKIACLVTNSGMPQCGGIRPSEKDLGLIRNAALVYSSKNGVIWAGKDTSLPKKFRSKNWRHISASHLVAYPGLVDPHTHPVFSGDRSKEFELRMLGASYQEIAQAGGGIVSSVAQTRKSSLTNLTKLLQFRLKTAHKFGVRLLEAKSGYGLNLAAELKSLQAIKAAQKSTPISIVPTCLAAHAIPIEKKNHRNQYIDEIIFQILPKVRRGSLAEYIDVFCDAGYFDIKETKRIAMAGKKLGFSLRLHGEELAHTGIAELATELGAHSVDHRLKISDKGIRSMALGGVVGVLLPGTSFYLREAPAPARKMIAAGMAVALASDFNPGTCPTQNLPFIGSIAAISLGMSTAEIIAGLTWNGARSLRREKRFGALLPGYLGEPIFCEGDHPSSLFYRLAPAELPIPTNSTL